MGYLTRRQRRSVRLLGFKYDKREKRESWPWLDELLAHAKRRGSRMCDRWDGYDDGERYSVTIKGARLIRAKSGTT